MAETPIIYIDADSCPVKDEVYKVALRHNTPVKIVSNSFIRIPPGNLFTQTVVPNDFDAADNFIAEQVGASSIVVTADILLAARCIKAGAAVIAPNGKPFTPNSIGAAVSNRAIMEDLRARGEQTVGPPPFAKADRSRFLSALHEVIVKLKRK